MQGGFNDLLRHTQAAIIAQYSTHTGTGFDTVRCCICKPYFSEYSENISGNGRKVVIIKWFELATAFTGAYRPGGIFWGCTAPGQSGASSTASSCHNIVPYFE
jgi:hypothetical protein